MITYQIFNIISFPKIKVAENLSCKITNFGYIKYWLSCFNPCDFYCSHLEITPWKFIPFWSFDKFLFQFLDSPTTENINFLQKIRQLTIPRMENVGNKKGKRKDKLFIYNTRFKGASTKCLFQFTSFTSASYYSKICFNILLYTRFCNFLLW